MKFKNLKPGRHRIKNVDLALLADMASQFAEQYLEKTVFLLEGQMGTGKSQFSKFFIESRGVLSANSPTYAIQRHYESALGDIDHLDLFRIESSEDLESIGFWDLFEDPKKVLLIEWPSKLFGKPLPNHWRQMTIQFEFSESSESLRNLKISVPR